MSTLFFVHSDTAEADSLAAAYRGRGWSTITSGADAGDAFDRLLESQPIAAVFCLDGDRVAEVLTLAERVAADPLVGRPLMVFVGGQPDDAVRARATAPYGIFVGAEELSWVLGRLVLKD